MRVELEAAYVLHARAYRETSLLLEAFSLQHGRVGLVARGVRGARSRTRALLQPFQPVLLSWRGGGELATLSGVEAAGPALALQGERLLGGLYANELLLTLVARDDAQPALFAHYQALCAALAAGTPIEVALRVFERDLLDALGYRLLLAQAADGSPLQAALRYRYVADEGAHPASGVDDGVPVAGASLLALGRGELADAAARADAKRLLRAQLERLLNGRRLRTRELARALLGGARGEPATSSIPEGAHRR
ncbi:DNA replication and repair protein RecO [Plasticicumulans lactativorans]|uniref:DNA repair protein RecO n=1 Tax=Plasticicumulans lactativorans TaxID=1133106 RepID=A0A4R2LC69_9GAMM|nr:DNA repair protein RecO [Plasticicumulans lactativorans]TCO80438.1 DNA replication and repair protein RecO [Plasticicumulans lactativorans]